MMAGLARRWTRKRLAVLAVFVAVAAFVFVAIWMQPAASGSNAVFTGVPGHNPTNEAVNTGVGVTQDILVWPYVDGGVITLITSIANRGPVGFTITGGENNGRPPDLTGVFAPTANPAAGVVGSWPW